MENQEKTQAIVNEMKEEFRHEISQLDEVESAPGRKVALPPLKIPDQLVAMAVKLENALILSTLPADAPANVKQLAVEALAPTKSDLEVTGEFMNQLVARYAPTAMASPLMVAATLWGANAAMKAAKVHELAKISGGKQ